MKKIRIILLFAGLLALSGAAHGQTTMDTLTRYIWEYIEENTDKYANSYMDFTETSVTETYEWLNEDGTPDLAAGTDVDTRPYYLKPLERFYGFDDSKVGQVRNGRVIVVKIPPTAYWPESTSSYFILSLTNSEMVLVSLNLGGPMITSRWRAIPRQVVPPPKPFVIFGPTRCRVSNTYTFSIPRPASGVTVSWSISPALGATIQNYSNTSCTISFSRTSSLEGDGYGRKTITATATNAGGQSTATHQVNVARGLFGFSAPVAEE